MNDVLARPVFWGLLGALAISAWAGSGQNVPPSSTHVIIPNPTPRPPDLIREYGDDSKAHKSQQQLSVKSQLRAREIWLESNQILLLTQQIDQQASSNKSLSMAAKAAKAGEVEKLARSIQEKMKVQ